MVITSTTMFTTWSVTAFIVFFFASHTSYSLFAMPRSLVMYHVKM